MRDDVNFEILSHFLYNKDDYEEAYNVPEFLTRVQVYQKMMETHTNNREGKVFTDAICLDVPHNYQALYCKIASAVFDGIIGLGNVTSCRNMIGRCKNYIKTKSQSTMCFWIIPSRSKLRTWIWQNLLQLKVTFVKFQVWLKSTRPLVQKKLECVI